MSQELERVPGASTQSELDLWREEFNGQRPHEALGMKCPGELYEKSARRYGGLPDVLDYGGLETRRIMSQGSLVWQGQPIFISSALAGWDVGLKPCGPSSPGRWEVYFGSLRLGELEPESRASERETVTLNQPSVTHVLNLKCYRGPDCALARSVFDVQPSMFDVRCSMFSLSEFGKHRTPNLEHRTSK
jgi:hypothetical protein